LRAHDDAVVPHRYSTPVDAGALQNQIELGARGGGWLSQAARVRAGVTRLEAH